MFELFFYKDNNTILMSSSLIPTLSKNQISPKDIPKDCYIYFLDKKPLGSFRRSFIVTSPHQLFMDNENLNIIINESLQIPHQSFIEKKIEEKKLIWVNTEYESYKDIFNLSKKNKFTATVVGLGDVGGLLVTGLRLLGGDTISDIKIFDKDENKMKRWEYEGNSIFSPSIKSFPNISICPEEELFNCDIFIFCVTAGIPAVGNEKEDVRLVQLKNNGNIIKYYAKAAREKNFKGIFAVVSDPVDQLCSVVFKESNKDSEGNLDYKGILPDKIKGYGLGVMNGRAVFYSEAGNTFKNYKEEGRAFGPHGEGLVIANSIYNYNEEASNILTEKTKNSNLEVRAFGFKPYIAPALSSGALSILSTLKEEWHYSSLFLGGVFMGMYNRWTPMGSETELYNFHPALLKKLQSTYNYLKSFD